MASSSLTPTRAKLVPLGLGILGGTVVLGGALWLIQRQIRHGDVIRVRMVHEFSPEAQRTLNRYLDVLAPISERGGLDVNFRLFPGRAQAPMG